MSTLQGWPQSFPLPTSDVITSPTVDPIALGTHARDALGNEYVYCDFDGNVYPEVLVTIGSGSTAAGAYMAVVTGTTGGRGPCGIVVGTNGQSDGTRGPLAAGPVSPLTSDQHGWVQIFGYAYLQIGTNASSPSDLANGPTTVETSLAIKFQLATSITTPPGVITLVSDQLPTTTTNWKVYNMFVARDASAAVEVSLCTAVSATHIGSHVRVFLNYPYVEFAEISS